MKKEINSDEYIYETYSRDTLPNTLRIENFFKLWSAITFEKNRMLEKTPEQLKEAFFVVFVVTKEDKLIGMAGVFPCIDKVTGVQLSLRGKLLGELGSIFVHSKHREIGHATEMVFLRLVFCEQYGLIPLMITQDLVMQEDILEKPETAKILLNDYPHMIELCQRMKCKCRDKHEETERLKSCGGCPYDNKDRVGFKKFEHLYA